MIEKGKIRAIELKNSAIGAGTVAMLKEGGFFKGVVTVTHLTPAQEWVVMSPFFTGPVTSQMTLNTIVIEDENKRCYPLVNKQWAGSKQLNQIDTDVMVEFEKKPFPFVAGLYSRVCRNCESHFQGGKKQPICENCCDLLTEAMIVSSVEKKPERASSMTFLKAKAMAQAAFEAGRADKTTTFEGWFNKHY